VIDLIKHTLEECRLFEGDILMIRLAGESPMVFKVKDIQAQRIRKAHAYANAKARANQSVELHGKAVIS
jgi:hypothetical protein